MAQNNIPLFPREPEDDSEAQNDLLKDVQQKLEVAESTSELDLPNFRQEAMSPPAPAYGPPPFMYQQSEDMPIERPDSSPPAMIAYGPAVFAQEEWIDVENTPALKLGDSSNQNVRHSMPARIIPPDELNDLLGAINNCSQFIALNPNYADAFYNRGILKKKINDLVGALVDYNEAILINPKFANAFYNRGILKDELNDNPGALIDYNQAIAISPTLAIAYINRGNLQRKLNDLSGALLDYNQATVLEPKYAIAFYNRGLLGKQINDRAGAIQDLSQAAQLFREQGKIQYLQMAIAQLDKLNTSKSSAIQSLIAGFKRWLNF
jgi:tetratricopeptide (TPR) repeat protein